jgi:hypothetical protein
MNEDQLTRLRNRLRRKQERLVASRAMFFLPKLRRFRQFLKDDPILAPILEELRSNATGQSAAKAIAENAPKLGIMPNPREPVDSLSKDDDVAAFVYHLLQGCFEQGWNFGEINLLWGSNPGNMEDYLTFKPEVIAPFCDYLDDRLDEQQAILGLLLRYKERCEWFNREGLLQIIEDEKTPKTAGTAKRAEVEDALKEDLYRYLHDQGFHFTIEPYSHKGKIDLILDQKGGGRKYLEGKVFENKKPRDRAFIIKGFGQLLHYLRQYNAANGYLLVYETCEEHLEIDGAEKLGEIPFVRCDDGKVIFVLVVDIFPYDKPVSQRESKPVRITADELCKADQGNQG